MKLPNLMLLILMMASVSVLLSACVVNKHTDINHRRVDFQYSSSASVRPSEIPQKVFVFPPLLADKSGKPKQSMHPQTNDKGGILHWKPPSLVSAKLHKRIQKSLSLQGYEVVDYAEVMQMAEPYSIMMLSFFYTDSYMAKQSDKTQKKLILTMIRGKLFDLDLNPVTSIDVLRSDGVAYCDIGVHDDVVREESIVSLVRKLGDDVAGHATW